MDSDINAKNDKQLTSLYAAIKKGNVDIVKLFLTNDGIDVNILNGRNKYEECTALCLAVDKGNVYIVKL